MTSYSFIVQPKPKRIVIDIFCATMYDGNILELTAEVGADICVISVPGLIGKARVTFKVPKDFGFEVYHRASISTLEEVYEKLSNSPTVTK